MGWRWLETTGRELQRSDPGRRRAARPASGRRGDLRRQPEHQLHERLHQALHLLRLQPRPPGGGGLFPPARGGDPPGTGSPGSRSHRGVHAGRARAEARRPLLHRPVPGRPRSAAGPAHPRLLARGGAVRRDAVRNAGRRVSGGAAGRRSRHAPRHVRRDPGRRGPRRHLAGPDLDQPVARDHHHGPPARHPDHLHDDVRSRRDAGPLGPAHGAPARRPEGHGRLHRVRAPVPHPPGGADVPPSTGPGRPGRGDGRRGRARARARTAHARRHDAQHPVLVGQGGTQVRPDAPRRGRQRPGRDADQREHLDLGRGRSRSARAASRAPPARA